MANYYYGTVSLDNMFQNTGGTVVDGFYNISGNTVGNISFLLTNFANNRPNPIPFPYQYINTSLGNRAAEHALYNSTTVTVSKPTGALSLRYIITGGGGGGGGGSGGAFEGAGENHITAGFNGIAGAAGGIIYSTADISVANVNSISVFIGAGGGGGGGGSGSSSNANNTNVTSTAGTTGGAGGITSLVINGITYGANGGAGGGGGSSQRALSSYGWASCMVGANTATANFRGNFAAVSGYGNTTYGGTDTDGNGNINKTVANTTANASVSLTNGANTLYNPVRSGGNGGAGGWGYQNANSGSATTGSTGNAGTGGQATIIWLY